MMCPQDEWSVCVTLVVSEGKGPIEVHAIHLELDIQWLINLVVVVAITIVQNRDG